MLLPLDQQGKSRGEISAAVRPGGPPAELGLGCAVGRRGLVGIAAVRLLRFSLRFPAFSVVLRGMKTSNSRVWLASRNLIGNRNSGFIALRHSYCGADCA